MRKIFFTLAAVIMLVSSSAQAAKIDMYRDAILNKNFTLKYEVQEIPVIQTSKDAVFSGKGLSEKMVSGTENSPFKGLIVVSGDDRYVEVFRDTYVQSFAVRIGQSQSREDVKQTDSKFPALGVCTLIKDGELFEFFWEMNGEHKEYFGGYSMFIKNKSVHAGGSGWFTESYRLMQEYNFGEPDIARALLPILPPEKIVATPQTIAYKFFNSGSLDGGLTYEDYVSDKGDIFNAVRYYFSGTDMVKIATVSYVKSGGKILGYKKSVIYITEFSPTADQNYLKLPAELKDKTKRDKEAKK